MASLSAQEELILLRKRARRRLVGAVALVSLSTLVLWNVVGHIPNRPMKPEKVEITANGVASAPVVQTASAPASATVMTPAELSAPVPQASSTHAAAVAEKPLAPVVAAAAPAVAALAAPKPKHETVAKMVAQEEVPVPAPKPKPHPKPAAQEKAAVQDKPPAQGKAAERKHKQADPAAILEGRAEDAAAAPAAQGSANEHKGSYLVQLAALTDPARADALKAKLSANGINARFSKVETSKGEVTRVRMGPFASRAEADAALRKLAKAGVSGIVVSK